jgi:hypothetical protein
MKKFPLFLVLLVFLCASCAPEKQDDNDTTFFGGEARQLVIVKKTRVGRTRCGGYYEERSVQSRALSPEDARAFLAKAKENKKVIQEKDGGFIYESPDGNLFKWSIGEGASFPCGEARPKPTSTPAY